MSCSHACRKGWWDIDKEDGASWPHCHQSPHHKSCLCFKMKPKCSNCHVKLLSIHQMQLLIQKETKCLISSGQLGTLQWITNRLVMMVLTKKDEACFFVTAYHLYLQWKWLPSDRHLRGEKHGIFWLNKALQTVFSPDKADMKHYHIINMQLL